MCRLFGMAAVEPVTATFWLLAAPDSLRVQSRREPDGTGLGWFEQAAPRVAKQPLAAFRDRAFAHEARTISSARFVAHVRFASTGALELRNTHPFEQEGRLFAHNGVVEGLDELERQLGSDMRLVGGETDSERLFALITREIARHEGDAEAAIETAVNWVAEHLPVLSLNFVLIAPDALWALRYPETHELYVLERPPGEPLAQRSSHGTRLHSEHAAACPTVVLASERMDADPGWRLLDCGELVSVGSGVRLRSRLVRSAPPAHPLTLAQLEGRARESQGGG
jgi:predicted glutamine amidotransferase